MFQVVRVLVFGKRLSGAVDVIGVRVAFTMRMVFALVMVVAVRMARVALVRMRFVAARMAMKVDVHGAVGMLMQVRMQDALLFDGLGCLGLPVVRTQNSLLLRGGFGCCRGRVNALVAHRLYPLYSRNRNSGAPKNEVIAPMGRMMGEMTTRATRSLASMMADPSTSEAGSKKR